MMPAVWTVAGMAVRVLAATAASVFRGWKHPVGHRPADAPTLARIPVRRIPGVTRPVTADELDVDYPLPPLTSELARQVHDDRRLATGETPGRRAR
jgi:hypothetical protein